MSFSSIKALKLFLVSTIIFLSVSYIIFDYSRTGLGDLDLLNIGTTPPSRPSFNKLIHVENAVSVAEATKAIDDGNLEKAEGIYNKTLKITPNNSDALYGLAVVYALQSNETKALDKLQDAFKLSEDKIQSALQDPRLESLRSSPRFQDLLKNLPVNKQ